MLNIQASTLRTVDSIGLQKCLLPKAVFSKIGRAGQWAKCYFYSIGREDVKNYSVCQIYPRDGDDSLMCFLDTRVCQFFADEEDQLVLASVITMDVGEVELEEVYVSFFLNTGQLIQKSDKTSLEALKTMARIFLQSFNLSTSCTIQCQELKENGVEFVSIRATNGDENGNFIVTHHTSIYIENVSVAPYPSRKESIILSLAPLKEARQQLDDLLVLQNVHCELKSSIGMSMNALIVGPMGCGKTTLVESFLQDTKCNVFRITATSVMGQYPGETEENLRKIFKTAQYFENIFKPKEHIVILLEDVHILCPRLNGSTKNSDSGANAIRITAQFLSLIDELFNRRSRIICLASTNSTDSLNDLVRRPGRFEREIDVKPLSEMNRSDAVQKFIAQYLPEVNLPLKLIQTTAKHTQGYTIADIALLCRNAAQAALKQRCNNLEFIMKEWLQMIKASSILSSEASAYRTTNTFSDIGGMTKMKKVLEISVLAGLKQEDAFRRFGLTMPKGILLYGPPGCAKTTVAKCLATEANMTFIATSAAEVYSPYVGCAEAFIAKIFDTARKNAPCLIFLDEIDSLVGRRSLTSSPLSDVQIRILSTLLTEMDGIISLSKRQKGNTGHILVVAATNRPDMVDDALMRPGRFDRLIHVPAPDTASRRSILSLYQQKMPIDKAVDLNKIAERTKNFSGADMCNLCNEAAIQAFQRDFNTDTIGNEDFEKVLKISKSSLTQSQINKYNQFEQKFKT